jgi:hypothetical protein
MGDLPINLAATSKRFSEGRFISDPATDALDAGTSNYAGFPPLGLITHASAMDVRHALIDKGAWAFYIQQSLLEGHVWPYGAKLASLPIETWARLIQTIEGAPKRLTIVQPGNHLLFLGERGARSTVAGLQALRSEAGVLRTELESMLR